MFDNMETELTRKEMFQGVNEALRLVSNWTEVLTTLLGELSPDDALVSRSSGGVIHEQLQYLQRVVGLLPRELPILDRQLGEILAHAYVGDEEVWEW